MNASKFCIIDLTYEEYMEQGIQLYGDLKVRHADVASQQTIDNVLRIENQMRNQG